MTYQTYPHTDSLFLRMPILVRLIPFLNTNNTKILGMREKNPNKRLKNLIYRTREFQPLNTLSK